MGGSPRTPKGTQGLQPRHNGCKKDAHGRPHACNRVQGWRSMDTVAHPTASARAICCQGHSMSCPLFSWVSADLQGGRMVSARNSRKPHGQPRNSREIQHAPWRPLVTPERTYRLRSRARRHPEELPGRQHRLCSDSPGGGATLLQGRPAWVPLFYGSRRVSDTGGHDPRTGFLPFLKSALSR